MIYRGTPTHGQTQVQGLINYQIKRKRQCAIRGYQEAPRGKGDVVQHVPKTHTKTEIRTMRKPPSAK